MSDSAAAAAPKPSSSVKLVLLGEAAVGKVCLSHVPDIPGTRATTVIEKGVTLLGGWYI